MPARGFGLAALLLLAGVTVASADENYRVVPAELLPAWWRPAPGNLPLRAPRGAGSESPSGCAAVALRIEPDGRAHQIRIIQEGWTPMSPYLHRLLDAELVRTSRNLRFVPGDKNPGRAPVYTYVIDSLVSFTSPNEVINQYKRKEVAGFAKAIAAKCEVPDFVQRVARATGTPMTVH